VTLLFVGYILFYLYFMHFAELMMPTEAKYMLCKILVSDYVLRKDFFL